MKFNITVMNYLIYGILLCVFSMGVQAQSIGYCILKNDSKKIKFFGESVQNSGKSILYYTETGKKKIVKQADLKVLYINGRCMVTIAHNPKKSFESLHEVVAFNDQYILTVRYSMSDNGGSSLRGCYLNILNRDLTFVNQKKIEIPYGYKKAQLKAKMSQFKYEILPFFKGCNDLIKLCEANVEDEQDPYIGIYVLNCGGSKALFE